MAFLRSHNLPATACFVLRYLATEDGWIPEDQLAKLLAPASLEGPAGSETGEEGGFATQHTLQSLNAIGLTEQRDGQVRLESAARELIQSDPERRSLLSLIRRTVLSDAVSTSWELTEKGGWSTDGAADFARAASWFLSLDPLGRPFTFPQSSFSRSAELLQEEQFSEGRPKPVTNATNWDDFQRWLCALGLGRRSVLDGKRCHLPDPTAAMREELVHILDIGEWAEAENVLGLLGEKLPILGSGPLGRGMREHLNSRTIAEGEGTADPSTSQAFLILQEMGMIEMEAPSDATGLIILWNPPDHHRCSRLRLVE